MMKILHINTLTEGGAAAALKRIHKGLLDEGIDSRVLSLYRLPEKEQIPNWISILDEEHGIFNKLGYSIRYRALKWTDPYYEYSSPLSIFRPEKSDLVEWADIINLHWVANFINYPTFFNNSVVINKPIIWRMPDLFPVRGVIHYDGYLDDKNRPLEKRAQSMKIKALSHHPNVNVVATSSWTLAEAKKSKVTEHARSFQMIHNALDKSKFENGNSSTETITKKLLFVAANLNNEKKGLNELFHVIEQINIEGWELIVVGKGTMPKLEKGIPIKYLGPISSEDDLIKIYHRADIFVSAANEEAFGQTIIEAMFCRKPVVAFAVGGIRDTVVHGETGYLIKVGDLEGFKNNLIEMMKDDELRKSFGKRGRERAERYFNSEIQIKKYIDLYQKLLNGN